MRGRSPLELMRLQVPTLFVLDDANRLRFIREPGYAEAELDPAPRVFLGRTREGNVWRFRHDLPQDLLRELEALCSAEPPRQDFREEPRHAQAIRAALAAHAPIKQESRGPAYWVPEDLPELQTAVRITDGNAHLLDRHFPWKRTSRNSYRHAPFTATIVGDAAVSICSCARITEFAAEAGVDTTETQRGHGYAGAAVALWARLMREHGRLPLYSTDWTNTASLSVARKLGLVPYGDDWSVY